jgi:hypothetical protein
VPSNEPFAPAYEFDVSFDGTVIGLNSFTYRETHETFDTSVHTDRGASSVGIAGYTCTVRFVAPIKVADEASYPNSGERFDPVVFTSGGKTRSGSIVITSMEETLGTKGGKNRNYEGVFSGVITNVSAGSTS